MSSDSEEEVRFRPIAIVHNEVAGGKYGDWQDIVSRIVFRPEFVEALEGIDAFSHIEVIFYIDRAHAPTSPRIQPRDRQDLPEVGYFSTHTPNRPNRIGVSTVRLLEKTGDTLVVQGLDTFDGTPVLDIKPFVPRKEIVESATAPEWMKHLHG
ncbi:MAG: tRNA (N6-threonylcarbamoyladenosine(37)-N6)-methyltransferase TrmO [Chloroflexota bacterium]